MRHLPLSIGFRARYGALRNNISVNVQEQGGLSVTCLLPVCNHLDSGSPLACIERCLFAKLSCELRIFIERCSYVFLQNEYTNDRTSEDDKPYMRASTSFNTFDSLNPDLALLWAFVLILLPLHYQMIAKFLQVTTKGFSSSEILCY